MAAEGGGVGERSLAGGTSHAGEHLATALFSCRQTPQIVCTDSPHPFDAVGIEPTVSADDRHLLPQCLCDE